MKLKRNERGQSILLFAILMPLMSLFLLGILDYMVTNARVMETVAAADLAAHAGAQEITVLPDGTITATTGRQWHCCHVFQRPATGLCTTHLSILRKTSGTTCLFCNSPNPLRRIFTACPLGDGARHWLSGTWRHARRSIIFWSQSMKSLWKTILDGLTYKDLAGKRQPRTYTVMTGLILLLLLMAGGMAGLNRYLLMSRVQATPVSVSLTTEVTETLETINLQPCNRKMEHHYGCPTDSARLVAHANLYQQELQRHPARLCVSGIGKDDCLGAGCAGRIQPRGGNTTTRLH